MTIGVLYLAIGEQYENQALESARSIIRFAPNLKFAICTNLKNVNDFWDCKIEIEKKGVTKKNYMLDKVLAFSKSPFDRTLYLDTDTYILSDISTVFKLLDRFEICVTMGHNRYKRHLIQTGGIAGPKDNSQSKKNVFNPQISSSFSPIQGGFLLYEKSDTTKMWFQKLLQRYIDKEWYDDQVSIRELLWEEKISFYTLPPEYNFAYLEDYKLWESKYFKIAVPKIFHYSGGRFRDLKKIKRWEKKIRKKIKTWSDAPIDTA